MLIPVRGFGKYLLLTALLFCDGAVAQAKRMFVGAEANLFDVPNVKKFVTGEEMICGEPRIWHFLTDDATIGGVENIKWKMIEALILNYLRDQEARIQQQEADLEYIKTRLEKARLQEQVKETTADQIKALIVGATAGFGGLEVANSTRCGKPGFKPRPPRRAFDKSVTLMKAEAEKLFTGEVRLDSGIFFKVCHSLLPPQEESYCERFCQRIKDQAQAISDLTSTAPGEKTSDLLKLQKEAMDSLERTKADTNQCRLAQEDIKSFETQLSELSQDVGRRFRDVQKAEMALDDATQDLGELEDLLAGEDETFTAAVEELKQADADAADAKATLDAVKAQEILLKGDIRKTDGALAQLQAKLRGAKEADKVIEDLKAAVTLTALKMKLFFDKAVLEPMREIGIHESLDLDEHFLEDTKLLSAAAMMSTSVFNLENFCNDVAIPSFLTVKDEVDLTPLCQIGDPCKIVQDIRTAVMQQMYLIMTAVDKVKTWFDPYKGLSGTTPGKVEEAVEGGEPRGIREYHTVYSNSKFSRYLRDWKLKGKFLKLIAQLKDIIKALEENFKTVLRELGALQDKMKATLTLRQEATEKLEAVTAKQEVAQEQKKAVEHRLEELREETQQMEDLLHDFEKQVWEAWQRYDKAKDLLLDAHKEGTSLLELGLEDGLDQLEEERRIHTKEVEELTQRLTFVKTIQGAVRGRLATLRASVSDGPV